MADKLNESISEFLENFPTYLLHRQPQSHDDFFVFSSKDEKGSEKYLSSADIGARMMHDKIKSAFSNVVTDWGWIVQFWAPVTVGGRRLLSTCGQPFAVKHLDEYLKNYRRRCVNYEYSIDVNNKFIAEDLRQEGNHRHKIMISGPPASTFLNRLTDIVVDSMCPHQMEDLFLCYVLKEYRFVTSLMMPICCPSQTSSSDDCIGVVECSSIQSIHPRIFISMKRALEKVGLSVFNVQHRIPDKTIIGLLPARDEIQGALKIVCELHNVSLAQVCIAYEDENYVPFPSSLENPKTKRLLGLKLTGFNSVNDDSTIHFWSYKDFYDACDMIPLQLGEELALKTLQDHEPRFCKYISKLGTDKLLAWASLFAVCETSVFAICLRSIDTGDLDFAFEFIWIDKPDNVIELDDLLLTLKRCLPRFKLASGAALGDKLNVIDVGNSSGKKIKKFKIFREKRLLPIPEALKEGNNQMVVDYRAPLVTSTMKQASENLLENIFGIKNLIADKYEGRSEFCKTFPAYFLHRKPESHGELWVFSSQYNPSSDDLDTRMIYENIKSSFSKVNNDEELIVQFWAPVTIGNRHLLSTSGQPFAVSDFCDGLKKYREYCVEYKYNIDMNYKIIVDENEQHEDHRPMIGGPPATAFLSCLPEAVLDTTIHREGSLMRHASECGLWTSYTLPICCPTQSSSSCIGVVECSSISSINLDIVNTMNRAIKGVGLSVFNVQDCIPYNTINGLKPAREEIEKALKIVCESNNIGLAQVWISYEKKNHVPFSSSLEDIQTARKLALKLTGYKGVAEDSAGCHWRLKQYCDACDLVPLTSGDELVEMTLLDLEPRFCENISQMGTNMLMAWASTDDDGSSGLTICMRSTDTGDFNYAFEFIWLHNSSYVNVLEKLLLLLKQYLPSFKFASGANFGDELHVIDVDNSTYSEIKKFKIFQGKRSSPILAPLDERKKQMPVDYLAPLHTNCKTATVLLPQQGTEQNFGTSTMKQAAENALELGDQLHNIDVKNSSTRESYNSKIFQGKRLSSISEAARKGKKAMVVGYKAPSKAKRDTTEKPLSQEQIEKQYGKTIKEAAAALGVSESTLKRKRNQLGMGGWPEQDLLHKKANKSKKNKSKQSQTNTKCNEAIEGPLPVNRNENTLIIKAEYTDDTIKFDLPISEATFDTIEKEIGVRFELRLGTYRLKYRDGGDWISILSNKDMIYYMETLRRLGQTEARLSVFIRNH